MLFRQDSNGPLHYKVCGSCYGDSEVQKEGNEDQP